MAGLSIQSRMAAGGVMPVAKLDGQPVRTGKMGGITEKIRSRYWDLHTDPRLSFAGDYGDGDDVRASATG